MKSKYLMCIIALLLVLPSLIQIPVYGAPVKYYYDNDWHVYEGNIFQLQINGKLIETQMPPIVFSDRSVVPARDIFESLGADVDWDAQTATVKVKMDDTLIKLKIDSTVAYINARAETMDIAPKIINEKTMIPVRFVGEKLGMEVDFDSSSDTIIVNTQSKKPPAQPKTQISSVSHELNSENTAMLLTIQTDNQNPAYSDFLLEEPERIVIDVKDGVYQAKPSDISVSNGNIMGVRFGQNEGNARIVVDVSANLGYSVQARDKQIIITVILDKKIKSEPKNPFDVFTYTSEGSRELFTSALTIGNVKYNEAANCLEISVTDKNLSKEKAEIAIASLFATKVKYQPVSDTDAVYTVVLNKNEITFTQNDNQVIIKSKFKPVKRSVMIDAGHGGQDPGAVHKDEVGNAIAQEKDINLAVALLVKEILEAKDIEVHMIRTTDVYIDYQKVGSIANDIGTTLFVSIHTNSADGVPDANGIEVFSYLDGGTVTNGLTGKQLAQNILNHMITSTGAKNRGVKNGQTLAVIRTTQMPAALVEVGFISNDIERDLMLSKPYQQKLAEGIANGIIKSFEDMGV